MADQWMQMLQGIPPGADVFDFIGDMLTDQMFPQFAKGYWIVIYCCIGVLSLTFLAILLAFYFKIRNKGFAWMVVHDGACSHISPKAWIPFFWGLMAPLLIGQIAWTHMTLSNKTYSGSFTAYSMLVGAIPIVSFAGLTLHVLTNAPPLRRFLIQLSRGSSTLGHDRAVVLLNASLFVWCAFAAGILVLPAKTAYGQGDTAGKVYAAAMDILTKAKATQDVAALVNLTPIMAQFGAVFSPFFIFYLLGAILPTVLLNVYIRNRIKDYDIGLSSHQASYSMSNSHPGHASAIPAVLLNDQEESEQLKDDTRPITVYLPQKLPKDRPFANTVEVNHTTPAPQHLQRIMDMKGAKPSDKSARLKSALRRDNQVLGAYLFLLSGMGSLAFWLLTGTANRMSAGESMRIALMWEVFSFTIPAAFMAALFLHDAFRNGRSDDEIFESVVPQSFSRHNMTASAPNAITLSQNVMIVEEYAMEDKMAGAEHEKMDQHYRYS